MDFDLKKKVKLLDGEGKMKYYFDTKYRLYIEALIEQEGENLVEITQE